RQLGRCSRRDCDTVDRGYRRLSHATIASSMAGVVDHPELAAGPCLTQVTWDVKRRTEVQPAVDEDSRYPGQPASVAQEGAILEESRVVPIMRNESGERQPEATVVVGGREPV